MRASTFLLLLGALGARAVTIYTTLTDNSTRPTNTDTATGPAYTGYTAYNLTKLTPPPLPNPLPNLNFAVQLYAGAAGVVNLSIPLKGSFFGYSIELSVANQFLGRNSSRINVPFLNYLGNIRARIGHGPTVRVGGNTQEFTELFLDSFPNHEIINKTLETTPNSPTATPHVNIVLDLLYMLNNITQFVGANWYLGLPFSYPVNISGISAMTEIIEEVLGDRLIALQLGNEPDLYGLGYRKRPFNYWVSQYMDEFGSVLPSLSNNSKITRQQVLLGPSICCNIWGNWSIYDVFNAGYLSAFGDHLSHLAVQHYPNDNCVGLNPPQAQDIFPSYLMHSSQTSAAQPFWNASSIAVASNKPLIMFETNTASCAGFPGLSDSFGAALWAIDWTMTLAFSNFSGTLFHFGGQNAAYNPFTPPPSNYSKLYQWTTGSLYYSHLVVAEALGSSNKSQVVDLQLNSGSPYTPGYAIYENGTPTRVLLINFMDDNGVGNAQYTGYVHIGGVNGIADTTPSTVYVRYLNAPSVSEKFNITWAGQTVGGGQFMSDGRMEGTVNTVSITCSPTTGCPIPVPAPGAALVFMSTTAEDESFNTAMTQTFPTTYFGKYSGPTADAGVLETSNGRGGPQQKQFPLGSTSHGNLMPDDAIRSRTIVASLTVVCIAFGAAMVGNMLVR